MTTEAKVPTARDAFVPVEKLVPYARNAKTHSPEQVEQIERLILKFGWTNAVLADEKLGITAGHGRVLAAANLYARDNTLVLQMADGTPIPRGMVPVIYAVGWSDDDKRAYVIADNKVAENAGWDADLLKAELAALQGADFDISLTGFEEKELVTFLAGTGGAEGDGEVPEDQYTEQYGVIVLCGSEAEQAKMYERLHAEGLNCRVVTT